MPKKNTENKKEQKLISGTQMHADNQDFKYTELTDAIIRIIYRVYNKLG